MDENLDDGGIYCFFPFEHLDKKNKGIFKIGNTEKNFQTRLAQYHTYYTSGVYVIAFIKIKNKKNHPLPTNFKSILNQVESYVIKLIQDHDGVIIVNKKRVYKRGETEFIYSSLQVINDCFKKTVIHFKLLHKNLHFIFDCVDISKTISQIELNYSQNMKLKDKYVAKYIFNTNKKDNIK